MKKQLAPITDIHGNIVHCSCGCGRIARHVHHTIYRCNGGDNHPRNLECLCDKCHRALHSQRGDFSRWGKIGGQITASKMVSIPNLRQFQGEAGKARWEAYCAKRAAAQMGVAA